MRIELGVITLLTRENKASGFFSCHNDTMAIILRLSIACSAGILLEQVNIKKHTIIYLTVDGKGRGWEGASIIIHSPTPAPFLIFLLSLTP